MSNEMTNDNLNSILQFIAKEIKKNIFQVGDIYITKSSDNPSERFGGEWKLIEGRFIFGAENKDGHYVVGRTGGAFNYYLEEAHIPKHSHSFSASTSEILPHSHTVTILSDGAHNHKMGTDACPTIQNMEGDPATDSCGNLSGTGRKVSYIPATQKFGQGVQNTQSAVAHTHRVHVTFDDGHNHSVSGETESVGGNQKLEIMPPYECCYIWERIA